MVRRAATAWRELGVRSEAEARGLLASRLTRRWGVVAARGAARVLLSRIGYVGMTREQVRACRQQPRPPAAGGGGAEMRAAGGFDRIDAELGALLHLEEGLLQELGGR